jgi:type VI secretion system secreted protein Hcp
VAAVAYFLKLDGIAGESNDAKHPGEIELESFSWGETQVVSGGGGGGGGAGKVQVKDLHVVMTESKASPLLFLACASGQHLKQAVLTGRKAGKAPMEFLVIKLTDVLVSSYDTGGGTALPPNDQVSLNFAKIEVSFAGQKPDGSPDVPVKAGWDVKRNVKV